MRMLLFILSFFSFVYAYGQETIKGKIMSANGHAVEYATVSVDSTFTLSDANGNFSLSVPRGHSSDLRITHISYKTAMIPRNQCGGNMNITLDEAVNELANVTISNSKKNKLKAISGMGVRIPHGLMSFKNEHNGAKEFGSIVKAGRDFLIDNITLKIASNSYTKSILRVIIYEIKDKTLTPIHTKPMYAEAKKSDEAYSLSFLPQQQISLKKGHRYYAALALVESSKEGALNIPAYFHSGLGHNTLTGNTRKIPASIGLKILGR